MVNHRQSTIDNQVILVQSDLISRKFDFCQTPAIILLEANPPHPGSDAVVGSYMYLELAADEEKKSNEPFLCLPAYMHSPEIYCHFTTSRVRSLVVFTIQ